VRAFMNLVCLFVWSEAVPFATIVITATGVCLSAG